MSTDFAQTWYYYKLNKIYHFSISQAPNRDRIWKKRRSCVASVEIQKLWLLKSDPVGLTKHIGKCLNLKWKTVVAEWYLGSIFFLKYSSFFWALLADWVWCLYLICFHTKYCFELIKFWKLKLTRKKSTLLISK